MSSKDPENWLRSRLKDLGASSATFYVPDTSWPGQLRLALMPRVRIREPMHGFVYPHSAHDRLIAPGDRATATYFPDAQNDPRLVDKTQSPLTELAVRNPLFGNFVHREGVASCARFRRFDTSSALGTVLFVNFEEPTDFNARLRADLRQVFSDLNSLVPLLLKRLDAVDPFPTSAFNQILQATPALAEGGKELNSYLETILRATLKAFDIRHDRGEGLGSIFRYEPRTMTLVRVAHLGRTDRKAILVNDVAAGQGVVSWVALRRAALLIDDVATSEFRKTNVYVEVAKSTRSELAVPILAGDELIGVLNLESSLPQTKFTPNGVRAVWWAATQGAVAYRIATESDRSRRLLGILQTATADSANRSWRDSAQEGPLVALAQLACDWSGAVESQVWFFPDETAKTPMGAGASQGSLDLSRPPREHGFTNWIRLNQTAVWISDVRTEERFACRYWRAGQWHRRLQPGLGSTPASVNRFDLLSGFGSQLGLPILIGERCIGVAWLKFRSRNAPLPSVAEMEMATGFAAGCGLVLDVLQHQQELVQQHAWRMLADRLRLQWFSIGSFECAGITGHVINQPLEHEIGGDFAVVVPLDARCTAFLIGDAERHGLEAAVRMLPIITAFRLISVESRSTKHVLQRIVALCADLGLPATAICFLIDRGGPFLFVTRAGHPPLIVVRSNGQISHVPDANVGALGWKETSASALTEECVPLSEGDYIIAYTDGVSEAGASEDHDLGYRGIASAAMAAIGKHDDPAHVGGEILREVVARDGGRPKDDITLMVVRMGPRLPRNAVAAAEPAGRRFESHEN